MIFKSGYKITQSFGENPEVYKPYGFNGHEGIDLIPNDADWNILLPEDGVVLQDIDTPRDNYGIYAVVWNEKTKRSWWFCHMAVNNVKVGQTLKEGDVVGKMGNTGKSTGPHLHLGVRYSDSKANAINTNNGYKGFVNPLPILQELEKPTPLQNEKNELQELKNALEEMRTSRNKWKADFGNLEKEFKKLEVNYKTQEKALLDSRKDCEELQGKLKQLQTVIATNKTPLSVYPTQDLLNELLNRFLGRTN